MCMPAEGFPYCLCALPILHIPPPSPARQLVGSGSAAQLAVQAPHKLTSYSVRCTLCISGVGDP